MKPLSQPHPRVLIVDPSIVFRAALKEIIAARCPHVRTLEAADADEALECARSHGPCLIILDMHTPGAVGFQLTRDVRGCLPKAVVAVTALEDLPEYREAALKSGADHFISKTAPAGAALIELLNEAVASR